MPDGSLRLMSAGPQLGGRGTAGGGNDAGEVRSVEGHAGGARVTAVAFASAGGKRGVRVREDVFVSVGGEGRVMAWLLVAGRERARPVERVWQGEFEARQAGETVRGSVGGLEGCRVAFDAGWEGRKGRSGVLAVGMTDGGVHVWTGLGLGEQTAGGAVAGEAVHTRIEAEAKEGGAVDFLAWDLPTTPGGSTALLVHRAGSSAFHRFNFAADHQSGATPRHTVFVSPRLEPLTALAADFNDPPPAAAAAKADNAGAVTGVELYSLPPTPQLSTPAASDPLASSSASPSTPLNASLADLSAATGGLYGANLFGRAKFVLAGDSAGRTFLFEWDDGQGEEYEAGFVRDVTPRKTLQEADSKVTALAASDAAVFVGHLDGTVRVFDPLSGDLLRTFKDRSAARLPARLLAQGVLDEAEEERWMVRDIIADREGVVVNVGGKVLAWRVKEELTRKGVKGKGAGKGPSKRQERFRTEQELRHQVQDSIAGLNLESTERVERRVAQQRVNREFGLPDSLEGLTEEEAVALAVMVSMEEAEAEAEAEGGGDGWEEGVPGEWSEGGEVEGEWEVDGLELDDFELGDAVGGADARAFANHRRPSRSTSTADTDDATTSGTRSPHLSTSLSVPHSPYLSTSPSRRSPLSPPLGPTPASSARSWTPVSPPSTAYQPYAYSPGSHHKVQMSPRVGATYGGAGGGGGGGGPAGLEEVPDLGEDAFPSMAGGGGGASPSPVAAPPSTALATPLKKGWSDVARESGASPSAPASASGSPARASPGAAAGWAAGPSALARQLAGGSRAGARHGRPEPHLDEVLRETAAEARRREEEEELEFVLRLSLAEAESRGEV